MCTHRAFPHARARQRIYGAVHARIREAPQSPRRRPRPQPRGRGGAEGTSEAWGLARPSTSWGGPAFPPEAGGPQGPSPSSRARRRPPSLLGAATWAALALGPRGQGGPWRRRGEQSPKQGSVASNSGLQAAGPRERSCSRGSLGTPRPASPWGSSPSTFKVQQHKYI